jgi:16S rRNA (adenine1518-N6/adenine1519-N6)-dimethyltransferase
MYLLGVLAVLGMLKRDMLSILCMAFLIQIIISPPDGVSLSFILSYLALAGILTAGAMINNLLKGKMPAFLLQPVSASLGAFLFTAAVSSWFFAELRPIGIIAGLFLAPLAMLFMAGSLLWLGLDFILPSVSALLGKLLSLLYKLMEQIALYASKAPGIKANPFVVIPASVLLIAILAWLDYRRRKTGNTLNRFCDDPPNYNSPVSIRAFLDKNGLGMRKKFGQNFLINPVIRHELASALKAEAGDGVWEIGPGIGAMTSLLLEKGLSVRAFEIDTGFTRVIKGLFPENKSLTLVEGDVLKTWPAQPSAPYLLGNLPYNIAATFLAELIVQGRFFKRMVVVTQREVALRMAASPSSADYSSFSVICSSAYRVKPLMLIKSASFYAKPNVDSQGVLLELKDTCALPPSFFPLVKRLFLSRRKTVKNNLAAFFAPDAATRNQALASAALEKCGIDGARRAEELSLEDFLRLAKTIEMPH